MLLLGHRGARRYAPENTFAAFDLALEHGCHGFEFDVRSTADARLVICHNARRGRLRIERSEYAALTAARSRPLRRVRGSEPALACLEQLLERYSASAFLDIELKVAGLEAAVLDLLARFPPQRGFLVSSFLPQVLEDLRTRDPRLPLGFLADRPDRLRLWQRLDVQTVLPHITLASRRRIVAMKTAGKQVIVWTVNRPRAMKRLAALGVDGIISDDTVLLCNTLGAGRAARPHPVLTRLL